MKKIEKLTDAQVAKFGEYVEMWVNKGFTTTQLSIEQARIDFEKFQRHILMMDNPAPVVLLNSPSECWVAVCQASMNNRVESRVESRVWDQVVSQVWSQVWNQVGSQVRSQVVSQVWIQVRSQVWSQVESQVWNQVGSQVRSQAENFIYPYFDCQFWAGFFSFYDFCRFELGVVFDNSEKYDIFKNCQKYGMVFQLENLCIVCQPPTLIKRNKRGLHCEDGPALSYSGQNEIYSLNGVVMGKKYILTSSEEISSKDVIKEKNVEVRRELLRKVGIKRLMSDLPHKLLDKSGSYELYSIDLSDELKDCKYLKMVNPSIGCFHLEGVAPECNTVSEALLWRNNNMFENAEILT